ncbi:sugar-transfer associated ATP-grasp domain-containing protein [Natronomonas sp. EA1]|uniref:sugar-transfer associated ATP-grasp domain-containing protein n=1 Tax=Natronomonas sp. EA1 TaxID=3421655 RepID=UPI003EC150A7
MATTTRGRTLGQRFVGRKRLASVALIVALVSVALLVRLSLAPVTTSPQYLPYFQLMLAGTIIAFLRHEVGVDTFGLFGPIVIALSFVPIGPFWGMVVFLNVFLVTLVTRLFLNAFRVGTAHRIAVLVIVVGATTIVIQSLAMAPVVAETGVAPLLFPAIITAWYAERFAGVVAELGWASPGKRLLWTLLTVVVAYQVITYDPLIRFVARTPEVWLLLIAVNVFVGTHAAVRVREFGRFKRLLPHEGSRLRRMLRGLRDSTDETDAAGSVLTMNVRNREYVDRYNPRALFPHLTKASMKRTFHGIGIPTPETYAMVESHDQLPALAADIARRSGFVIKPAAGLGGEGVLVVRGRTEDGLYRTNAGTLTLDDILTRVERILDTRRPGGGRAGVIVERLVAPTRFFIDLCGDGVPDVRVIVFRGHPVMTMLRLPTADSDSVANLHKGGIGVGVALATGTTTGAFQQTTDRWLEHHPDTGAPLIGVGIPDWEAILELAVRAAAASKLGYAGVDIVVDEAKGPLVLEVNKRPGLGIQNANRAGLRSRLRFVESLPPTAEFAPVDERVAAARAWDGQGWPSSETARSTARPPGHRPTREGVVSPELPTEYAALLLAVVWFFIAPLALAAALFSPGIELLQALLVVPVVAFLAFLVWQTRK